jgi:hypothetical protein
VGKEEKMNQKPPFADLIEERQPFLGLTLKRLVVITGCLAILATGIWVMKDFDLFKGPKKTSFSSQNQSGIQQMVNNIQRLEREISRKQSEAFKLLVKYKTKTGKELSTFNIMNLTRDEKNLLEKRIQQEKEISVKSLLKTILIKSDQIMDMQKRITALKEKMPRPILVSKGNNHYQIAMNYLTKTKGLDKSDAIEMVEKSILCEHLIPGFKVWNYYENGDFGSFVTQGDASISPGKVEKIEKQKSISRTQQIVEERDRLTKDLFSLKITQRELNRQLADLHEDHNQLAGKYSTLDREHKELEREWNSLYYLLDMEKFLVKRGILKRGLLKKSIAHQIPSEEFNDSIDLRTSKQIHVPAARFAAKKIKKVVLYPKFYKKGIDYEVSVGQEGSEAVLTILNPEKLRNERIVISVE